MKIREMYALALVLALSFITCVVGQEVSDSDSTLFQQLQSRKTTDNAKDALLKRAAADQDVRRFLSVKLPPIIEQGGKKPTGSWMNAVRLAGELKLAEAAPALSLWIGLDNMGGEITAGSVRHLETVPAGKALAQIGDPAVPSLSIVLDRGTPKERLYAYLALNLIASERSLAVLRSRLDREDDQEIRKHVESVIAMKASPK